MTISATPCPTCGYDEPPTPPKRGGLEEDLRAHADDAYSRADRLARERGDEATIRRLKDHGWDLAERCAAESRKVLQGKRGRIR